MMEMLRNLRSGGTVSCALRHLPPVAAAVEAAVRRKKPPVMECPQGQVGTYPNCTDPPPTDEERIADGAGYARGHHLRRPDARAGLARSADASAVEGHDDATEAQKTSARNLGDDARNALTDIVTASAVVNVATTGAQAEGAVAMTRQAALTRPDKCANVAGDPSGRREMRWRTCAQATTKRKSELATNGSSLIQHVRDNKLVYDAVISDLKDATSDPLHRRSGRFRYQRSYIPGDHGYCPGRQTGGAGGYGEFGLNSDGYHGTSSLTGTGQPSPRLRYEKRRRQQSFVNAYTDINRDKPTRKYRIGGAIR